MKKIAGNFYIFIHLKYFISPNGKSGTYDIRENHISKKDCISVTQIR